MTPAIKPMFHEFPWTDMPLHKGMARLFDEAAVPLASPCFLATDEGEARYYAGTLDAPGDAARRVVTYRAVRPLRLLMPPGRKELSAMGLDPSMPVARLASAAGELGWDGLALYGGSSGWHVVLSDISVLVHVSTELLEALAVPGP